MLTKKTKQIKPNQRVTLFSVTYGTIYKYCQLMGHKGSLNQIYTLQITYLARIKLNLLP